MEKHKKIHKNNKFEISASTWNDEFELPDGLYSVKDIQEYLEYIIKKHETVTDNPSINIYVNEIENRIAFKIKTRYYFKNLLPETMKVLESTKCEIK